MPKTIKPETVIQGDKSKIFQLLLLENNPFHPDPDPTKPPKTFADFRDVWKLVTGKVNTLLQTGFNQRLALIANNGYGKSHILRFLAADIDTIFQKQDFMGISFYTNLPLSRRFRDLYGQLVESVGFQKLLWVYNQEGHFDKPTYTIEYNELLKALLNLKDEQKYEKAWKWLIAKPTLAEERRDIGVNSQLHRDDDACLKILISIQEFLISKKIQIIFIGIDELERLGISTSRERRQTENIFEYFRNMIDLFPNKVFFTIAGTLDWDDAFSQHGALRTRFGIDEVKYLEDFSTKSELDYKLFILEYLDIAREKISKRKIRSMLSMVSEIETVDYIDKKDFVEMNIEEEYDYFKKKYEFKKKIYLYPFTSDCLKILKAASYNLPRNIVTNCNKLIQKKYDDLISREELPEYALITKNDLSDIFEDISIYESLLEE